MSDHDNGNDQRPPHGGRNDKGPERPGRNNMRMSGGMLSWILFIAGALVLVGFLSQRIDQQQTLTISEFDAYLSQGKVKEVKIGQTQISGRLQDNVEGAPVGSTRFTVPYPPAAISDELVQRCLKSGAAVTATEDNNIYIQMLFALLPWIVLAFLIWFFVIRQLRAGGGGAGMLGNFGKSKHRMSTRESSNITFKDVAGIEEAKDEVTEVVEFLKNPRRFQRLGGRIPRGVLLVGEPGCGKTLLAKAIAGEADVPFFSISGSDFVEMFVGVGASRVRDLFKQAKDNSPCIIFLDEIDAVGRRRGSGFNGGGHDEREQTLNAILVEMDGFDSSDQVIVVAATNRVDVLDPALTRPGRFDRNVFVPLPDVRGRLEILKVHARKVKLGPDVELMRLARGTPRFSGAELAAIINESALIATLANKDAIEMADMEEARDKVRWGRANRSRAMDERDKLITAYHEAGHALLMHLLPDAEPLHKVSILPRGQALGVTFRLPEKDRYTMSRKQALAELQVMFGGRIAEDMFFEDVTSGATMDIQQATELSRTMVCDWGMSEALGPIRYGQSEGKGMLDISGPEYSDSTAERIDHEVRKLIDEANRKARDVLEANRENMENLAQALMKYETLDAADVDRIIKGEALKKPSLSDLIDSESNPPTKPEAAARPAPKDDVPVARPGGPLPNPGMG